MEPLHSNINQHFVGTDLQSSVYPVLLHICLDCCYLCFIYCQREKISPEISPNQQNTSSFSSFTLHHSGIQIQSVCLINLQVFFFLQFSSNTWAAFLNVTKTINRTKYLICWWTVFSCSIIWHLLQNIALAAMCMFVICL